MRLRQNLRKPDVFCHTLRDPGRERLGRRTDWLGGAWAKRGGLTSLSALYLAADLIVRLWSQRSRASRCVLDWSAVYWTEMKPPIFETARPL